MAPKKESPPNKEKNEELADTLTAISVVAKNLAKKVRNRKEGDNQNADKSKYKRRTV